MQKHDLLGKYVSITVVGWEGRKGFVTSIGHKGFHVNKYVREENWETDFTTDEVQVI